ncbi:MAG: Methionine-tRNA ligase [Microgenomates group bacterium GW2011_GWA1_48_10]|uniref:Methionine--tRNA ligase n=1 Tax=Candidatus Gottesmanbacteria bacterium RIFCSPHIGHO2_01_FULL_47_48 TaxID=1798381 RepID=A0A1F5ZZA7_9BACT|nr:MAG: Methionine-tRNA ligase [Microgenomates group bacterium GW2011_GWA1_48_10]OGG17799.1 MAG: methionine--tRNA ligase [Candidatus Gottesmanbacteria bacterium RIFCSPHIGHO2_01_FULL_47_48]
MNKFYVTTAIPYVNAKPHVGHALEFVQGDVIARYHRLLGEETLYLSGADENALKNVQAAEKAGKPIHAFIDEHNSEFQDLIKKLNVSIDVWQRGSDEEHHYVGSQKLWKLCEKDIYKKKYRGLYCVGCEQFYERSELNENGECFEHPGKKLDEVEEENYFFRLSAYKDRFLELITSDTLKVIPEFRKNEVINWLKGDVPDLSISRSNERAKNWGVPVSGDDSQRIYVWFDALNIYQTGIGFGWNEEKYAKWWPADLHLIGKGITRFHAVYWPAFLLSAGLSLPKNILIHGYFTVNGQKMSKTLGNVLDPVDFINKYGADSLRYFFLAKTPLFDDGDFSEEKFKEAYNADLANGLGNLVARIAKLAEKIGYDGGNPILEIYPELDDFLKTFRVDYCLEFLWGKIKSIDQAIDQGQPWKLPEADLKEFLFRVVPRVQRLAYNLQPFLPETAKKIQEQFMGKIRSTPPLFPRIS